MSDIVPFGKHKGKPIDALLDDREYLDWLLSQGWFQQRYRNIYQIVINNGQEPSETPEHNAMQIKFLDEEYRLRFAFLAHGERVFAFSSNEAVKECLRQVAEIKATIIADFEESAAAAYERAFAEYLQEAEKRQREKLSCDECRAGLKKHVWHLHAEEPTKPTRRTFELQEVEVTGRSVILNDKYGSERRTNKLIVAYSPIFESEGVDVRYSLYVGFELFPTILKTHKVRKYGLDETVSLPKTYDNFKFSIEIKPSVGDDYPAVLRQIQRNKSNYLLTRAYNGVGATKEQFVQFFASQGIKVVFEADVDAAVLPPFEREMSL